MKTTNNIVLITGGGSGIGFETARIFSQNGNKVIITGRNEEKLKKAAAQLENTSYIINDITDAESVESLYQQVKQQHPGLNILVNNAGLAYLYQLSGDADAFTKASAEMVTNYLSTVRLTEKFLPILQQQPAAAIVNVTSIVSFTPSVNLPTYSASKAALHSYSQALRLTLENSGSNVKVIEVMPPLVDTDFAKAVQGNKIKPSQVAADIFNGLATDQPELHVASTADLYHVFLQSPKKALYHLNGIS